MIWGTDVNVGTCKEKFQVGHLRFRRREMFPILCTEGLIVCMLCIFVLLQRFLQRFIDPSSTEDENAGLDLNEPLYMQKLEEVLKKNKKLFVSLWFGSLGRFYSLV